MNLSEFKAWFEGFTEDMKGPPSEKQWKRIKVQVSEIISEPTPWPIFVDRYVRPQPQWWYTWGGTSASLQGTNAGATSDTVFTALGQAEANDFQA